MKDSVFRLSEIAATQAALADEAQRILAALAGAAPGAGEATTPDTPSETDIGMETSDAPSPKGLIALKCAAHQWDMTERRFKPFADRHGALHKIGGRWMIDALKLTAAVFR